MPLRFAARNAQNRLALVIVLCSLAFPLNSCGSQQLQYANPQLAQGEMQVLQAQQARMRKVEVTIDAPVLKLLPDDTQGLPHQRFLLKLSNGSTVLVAHDTAMAPRVPLQAGDMVRIHGEYIWNERGGVIHWTHHSDTPRHEGGWILFNGQVYQ
jgi:hypothetical protein